MAPRPAAAPRSDHEGALEIATLHTDVLSSARLEGVVLRDGTGKELLGVDAVEVDFSLRGLLTRTVRVSRVEAVGLRMDASQDERGLDLARLWVDPDAPPAPAGPWAGLPVDLLVDGIHIEAPRLSLRTSGELVALTGVTVRGGVHLRGDEVALQELTLDGATEPDLGPLALRASAAYDPRKVVVDTLTLAVGPQRLALAGGLAGLDGPAISAGFHLESLHLEPDALPWDLPVTGVFDVTGEVGGLVATPVFALKVQTPGGLVRVDAAFDQSTARPTWKATVEGAEVAVHAFVRDLDPTVVSARVQVEGAGKSWPDDIDANVTIEGTAPRAGPVAAVAVSGHASLARGVVTLDRFEGSTSSGTVAAVARLDAVAAHGTAQIQALTVELADLARFGVAGLRGSARYVGDVTGDWSGPEPAVRLDGTIWGDGVGYTRTARVRSLTGPVQVDWSEGAGTLVATLDARGLTAGSATVARIDATTHFARSRAGALAGSAGFTTGAVRAGALAGDHAIGNLSIAGNDLVAKVDLFDAERVVVGVDAVGDLKTRHFEAPRLILAPEGAPAWRGQGTQTVTLADDGVDDLHLALTSEAASIGADGSLHTRGDVALAVNVVDVPLDLVRIFDPALTGYAGLVRVEGTVGGRWDGLTVALDAGVEGLVVPGALRGVDAVLRVDAHGGPVALVASLADAEGVLVTATGTVPVSLDLKQAGFRPEEPLDLVVDVPATTGERWNAVLEAAPLPTLRAVGHAQLTGTPLHPDVHLVANVELPSAHRKDDWFALDIDATVVREALALTVALREGDEPRGGAEGTARLYLDRIAASLLKRGPVVDLGDPTTWAADLDLTVTPDLPVQALAAFLPVPAGVTGQLTGEVRLRGSPVAPSLEGALEVHDALLDTVAVSPATLSFSPRPGGYAADAAFGFGADGDLTVAAFLPLDLRPGVSLDAQLDRPGLEVKVGGEGVPLAAVAALWPEMQDAAGRVTLRGRMTGALSAPSGDLTMTADGARFRLASTGVAYDEVAFALTVSPDAIRLDKVHVRTSLPGMNPDRGIQGSVDGSLEAQIEGTTLTAWKGNLMLQRPLISAAGDRFLRLATGRVNFSGTPDAAKVTGGVTVEEARLSLDEKFFEGPASTAPPPWLHVHRGASEAQAEAPLPPPRGIPKWLDAKLGLDLGRNTFLQAHMPLGGGLGGVLGPLASLSIDTQADGRLSLAARDGALSITGQVLPLRGTTVLFGKSFEILDDSVISFTGLDYTAPLLDVHAAYDTGVYGTVEANINGTPQALKVTLTSATYPSQDDVVALLLVGKPASEMSVGESAGEGASAAAISMLLTTLGQSLGREGEKVAAMVIAPDLLVVGDERARVGKRIGKRVFVVVDLDSAADDRTTSYLVLTVEVALWGPWEAEFSHGTAGEDALELNWTRRY